MQVAFNSNIQRVRNKQEHDKSLLFEHEQLCIVSNTAVFRESCKPFSVSNASFRQSSRPSSPMSQLSNRL